MISYPNIYYLIKSQKFKGRQNLEIISLTTNGTEKKTKKNDWNERMGTVDLIQPLGRLSTLLVLVSVHSWVGLDSNEFG